MYKEELNETDEKHPFKKGFFPFPFGSYDQFICIGFCSYKSKKGHMKKGRHKFKRKKINATKSR